MLTSHKMTIIIMVAALFCLGMSGAASAAENCKRVEITIINSTGDEVKVTRFRYYDFDADKWRTENMFGVDGHQKLKPGKGLRWTRNLRYVNNDDTKFEVTYRHRIGGTKWESALKAETDVFECEKEMQKTITLTQ